MIDLRTAFSNELQMGDLALDGGALAQDESLVTAIILSLFTNRRAREDDALPYGDGDRRGWWGDLVPPVEGDQIGSRLWLLWREKALPLNLTRAREYALEALHWAIDDGHATKVEVEAEETKRGVLGLKVVVTLVSGEVLAKSYSVTAEAVA